VRAFSVHSFVDLDMAIDPDFVDYYELLEVSSNASTATVERIFRYLAKRHHPDSSEHGDAKTFSQLVEAYETLSDPAARAEYDANYEYQRDQNSVLMQETGHLSSDAADRQRMLSIFYAQRRRNMKTPGIGTGTLESMMGLPAEVLYFHLWFFQQKGWIMREESGQLSITADGVEKVEANMQDQQNMGLKRITQAGQTAAASVPVPPSHSAAIPASV
jgi:hypothetical protein